MRRGPSLSQRWPSLRRLFGGKAEPARFEHRGVPYRRFLALLHTTLRPRSYLEIGVAGGETLKLATCHAVGVDPAPSPSIEATPNREIVRLTSDAFFARDAAARFPEGVDLAFIDGMHLVEVALRDVLNTERLCHPGSLIVLHDCLPINTEMAWREHRIDQRPDLETRLWWTGDVWKLLPILAEQRPELTLTCLDCPPTGLVLISGVRPGARLPAGREEDIIARYREITLESYGLERLRAAFPVASSRAFAASLGPALAQIGVKSFGGP